MKKNNLLKLLSIFIVLLFVSLACGGSNNSGTLVEPAPNNQGTTSNNSTSGNNSNDTTAEDVAPAFYNVGDIIEVQDHIIALTEVDIKNGILIATFSVKNNGTDELNLSTLLNFSARNDEGENLEQEIFDCSSGLDGTVVSGDIVRGNICWSGASFPGKLYYDASLFSSGTTVWQFDEAASSDVSFTADEIKSFAIGDIVEVQDHQITLVETNLSGDKLTVTFLIENTSSSELNVSSLLSFSVKNSKGESLEQEFFDCSSGLDGTVVAGDKLKGSICWNGATTPVSIYYDASLFGSGTVVWVITE